MEEDGEVGFPLRRWWDEYRLEHHRANISIFFLSFD